MSHSPRQMLPPPSNAYCKESNKYEILGVTGAMLGVAVVVFGLRMIVRTMLIKSVGSDDWAMLSAVILAVVTFVCFVAETEYAAGRHVECLTPDDYTNYLEWQFYHSMLVMIGVVMTKISIALFLMRLVPPKKIYKQFLWGSVVFLVCFCLTCLGTLIFQCSPIKAAWSLELRALPTTKCFSKPVFTSIGLYNSSVNCITDFLFAILPVPIIINLQVNLRTKFSLAAVLSLGYFACAAGIVKAIKQHNLFREKDLLWKNDFNVWNMIELCVGIVAASLPALRPLFSRILDKTKTYLTSVSEKSKDRTYHDLSGHGPSEIILQDWKDVSKPAKRHSRFSTTQKTFQAEGSPSPVFPGRVDSRPDHRYAVGVTGGRDPGDNGSWEDIEQVSAGSGPERSSSEEGRYGPAAIYKTTDISSYSGPKEKYMI